MDGSHDHEGYASKAELAAIEVRVAALEEGATGNGGNDDGPPGGGNGGNGGDGDHPSPPSPLPPPADGTVAWIPAPDGWRVGERRPFEAVLNIQEGAAITEPIDLEGLVQADGVDIIRPHYVEFGTDVVPEDWAVAVDGLVIEGKVFDPLSYGRKAVALSIVTNPANLEIQGTTRVVISAPGGGPVLSPVLPISPMTFRDGQPRDEVAFLVAPIRPREASPLRWFPEKMRTPASRADHESLAAPGRLWCGEGLTHQHGTGLYGTVPYCQLNAEGSNFVGHLNPQSNGRSEHAVENVARMPAHDGNPGDLSPYTTLVPGRLVLASGFPGWLGIEIDGRVIDVDLSRNVDTWFGPRSVGMDSDNTQPRVRAVKQVGRFTDWHTLSPTRTLAARIKAGEKEFVGDPSGGTLWVAQDIAIDPEDGNDHYVADTGHGSVALLCRRRARIMRRWPIEGVSSVFADEALREVGVRFAAVNEAGIHLIYMDDRDPAFVPVPSGDAFWVRGARHDLTELSHLWIMTRGAAFYEFDPRMLELSDLKPPETSGQDFVFFIVDERGHLGHKGWIYYSYVNAPGSATAFMKFNPFGETPALRESWRWSWRPHPVLRPDNPDRGAHYPWGVAQHGTLPGVFVATGIANSSWTVWRTYLDDEPVTQAPRPDHALGRALFHEGKRGLFPPISALFGGGGFGALGYSADMVRGMGFDEARDALEPLLPPVPEMLTDEELDALAGYIWALRTRDHF